MKGIIPTVIGGYPRPDWFKAHLKNCEGLQKAYLGGMDAEYRRAVKEVLAVQKNEGIVLCTDGQLLWQDMLCHLCTRLSGFEMGGLIRYFDNNNYYRMPEAKAGIERDGELVVSEYKEAKKYAPGIKPVLSCYSLAQLSKNSFYKDKKDFILDLAKAMNREAKELAAAGAKYIQVDEPAILYAGKEDIDAAKDAFCILTRGVGAKFIIATYYKGAGNVFPELLDFPVDVIGLDYVEGYAENIGLLKEYAPKKILQAGIVDGRTTRMEKKESVRKKIDEISALTGPDLFVSPNTGLEYLPYQKAGEKLSVLCGALEEGAK
jgi:5-methyltetrahydropteroyltriglutamate--homocysteine methyltransferase